MITPTSYLDVHATFLVPPIVGLCLLAWRRSLLDRRFLGGSVILVCLAVGYTAPWDARLIAIGVWWYGENAVVWQRFGIPLGEFVFFVLQPIVTLLWLQFVLSTGVAAHPGSGSAVHPGSESAAHPGSGSAVSPVEPSARDRWLGLGAGGSIAAIGGLLLIAAADTWLYFGAILLWAGPVLAVQWAYDLPALLRRWRTVAIGILVPTGYLCLVDWIAIDAGIWTIASTYTTGLTVGGLPIEEGLFFVVTNGFLVQGYLLYSDLIDRRTATRQDVEA